MLFFLALIVTFTTSHTCVHNPDQQTEMDEKLAGYEACIMFPDEADRILAANYNPEDL